MSTRAFFLLSILYSKAYALLLSGVQTPLISVLSLFSPLFKKTIEIVSLSLQNSLNFLQFGLKVGLTLEAFLLGSDTPKTRTKRLSLRRFL